MVGLKDVIILNINKQMLKDKISIIKIIIL